MDERERQTLVALATVGDADAVQRLIVEYHDALRRAVAGRIDDEWRRYIDPDDVLQDAYAAAFKNFKACHFESPAAFYHWLETTSFNELKARQRALKAQKRDVGRELHRRASPATSYLDLVERLTASEGTPSRHAARGEAVAALLSSIARLTEDQRNVVRLRFLEGKPVAEVAACLGKTEAAVHALCRRGLRAIRESMVSISRFLTHL